MQSNVAEKKEREALFENAHIIMYKGDMV